MSMTPEEIVSPASEMTGPGTAIPAAVTGPEAAAAPRQTLAMRLAERNRMRAQRAERLARLRPGADSGRTATMGVTQVAAPVPVPLPTAGDAEAALEEFLRALTGGMPPPALPEQEPAAVLHFQRPEGSRESAREAAVREIEPSELTRLPGIGPGLVGALERAGFARLADIAPLAPEELAARLGPIGRLVPTATWVQAARTALSATA